MVVLLTYAIRKLVKKMKEIKVDIVALNDIARHAGDKTNTAVAERINMNRNTVSKVMNGIEKPSSAFMFAFVAAYNVEASVAGTVFFSD